MPFKKVEATNIADAAASQIRELIAFDVLKPGDVLPSERELCDRMGISRTSLRSALQTLTAEGLLLSKRGSGLRVADALGASISDPLVTLLKNSPNVRDDYLKFRILLETACASEVAAHGTAGECEHIARNHQKMLDAINADDLSKASQADLEFHMSIVEASGNLVSIQIARSLNNLLEDGIALSHRLSHENATTWQVIAEQHDAINAAIAAKDPTRAGDAMYNHLEYQRELAKQYQQREEKSSVLSKRIAWDEESDSGRRPRPIDV